MRKTSTKIKLGAICRTAVAAEAKGSVPRDGLNNSRGGIHFPDAAVEGIDDEEVSGTVSVHSRGLSEFRVGGQATVPTETKRSIARDGLNVSRGGIHLADATV